MYILLGDADADEVAHSREVVAFHGGVGIVDAALLALLLSVEFLQTLLGNYFVAFAQEQIHDLAFGLFLVGLAVGDGEFVQGEAVALVNLARGLVDGLDEFLHDWAGQSHHGVGVVMRHRAVSVDFHIAFLEVADADLFIGVSLFRLAQGGFVGGLISVVAASRAGVLVSTTSFFCGAFCALLQSSCATALPKPKSRAKTKMMILVAFIIVDF